MSKKNKYIQVRISEELKNRVEQVCEKEYTTISSLVTRLLVEYVVASDFVNSRIDKGVF